MYKLLHDQEGVRVASKNLCCFDNIVHGALWRWASWAVLHQLSTAAGQMLVCSHYSSVLLRFGPTSLHHGCVSKYPRRDCLPQVTPRPRPDELCPRLAIRGGAETLSHLRQMADGVRKVEAVWGWMETLSESADAFKSLGKVKNNQRKVKEVNFFFVKMNRWKKKITFEVRLEQSWGPDVIQQQLHAL